MRESVKARQAWADYLGLGPDRSLEKLHALYQSRSEPGPTRHLSQLKTWSARFNWQLRLQHLADQAAAEAAEQDAAYRRSILEDGYGLAHERVALLKRLAAKLQTELLDERRLWVTDVKQIGVGRDAERVEVERFNAAEVAELRALLDDIAKEKGERTRKVDIRLTLEREAERLADELGIDKALALHEAEALLAGRR